MEKLTKITWGILALDAVVALLMVLAVRRGIGQVYAIFGTLLLLMMASIAGLSTVFYSRRGMWASLVLVTSPPVVLVFEAARRVVLR
jgi:hypothetical protein